MWACMHMNTHGTVEICAPLGTWSGSDHAHGDRRYTSTPDHDYIISRVPGQPSVVLAGGGSGHAFKMGPAIGEAAASLALGDAMPPFPLERFAVERLLHLRAEQLDHEKNADRR